MITPAHARSGEATGLTNCDREPIHIPGTIQSHGALMVADARDLRVTHVSGNLGPALLGRPLAQLLSRATVVEIETSLRDGAMNNGRVYKGFMPYDEQAPCEIVVHRYDGRIYVELEPLAGDDARSEDLMARAHAVMFALRRAHTRQELCEAAVEGLKTLTGFDRVMAYRFDGDANGEVIAEARNNGMESFLGLRYPASDIPPQARRLYLQQRVRVIPNVDYASMAMLAEDASGGLPPLDMSFCHLRGISPMHLQYLRNMGVSATLAISIVPDDALWGMLICHHRAPHRISAQMRATCDLIGQVMSLLVGAKAKAETLSERMLRQSLLKAIGDQMLTTPSVAAALLEDPEAALRLVHADGAVIQLGGQVELIGRTPPRDQALAVAAKVRAHAGTEVFATPELGKLQPEFASLAADASGVLSLPILYGPEDGITWFRGEVAHSVTWGGNPDKAMELDGDRLSPRKSFAAWRSLVQGQSVAWNDVDLQIACELRRLVMSATLRHVETQARLANLRHYDALTNLPNRRLLQERLASRAAQSVVSDVMMIFLDLDRFKAVNDSLGHSVGDELLVRVAERLVEHVPARHLIARLGGDEFVVLCEETTFEEAQELANYLVDQFRTPFTLAGKPYRLSTSVGVAASTHGGDDIMRSADIAMYAAKRRGGNQAIAFDHGLQDASVSRLEIEQDLYEALERGEFELLYQPLVRMRSGEVFSFEALLRWNSPTRGLVSPNDFIPLAEETGLIVPIGAWVLREALRQIREWRERFGREITVSVNVSAQQTAQADFPNEIAARLAEAELPPSALIVEVTESILAQDVAVAHLGTVRRTGVRVAVDDFGTGYSSLGYLQRLPVDELKIDKLFVDQIGRDERATGMMRIVIQLGHLLGLDVVAEGVETERQWIELEALGCDAAQGYWMSKPLSAGAAGPLLRTALVPISPASEVQSESPSEKAVGSRPAD
jgi:diguanylate cyclase (GGDEF)-like protein